ncbi:hypothetical protein JW613_21845 [Streptomyces smyrnaeus]|uniref:Uncharacterized protein n=1 Tax=Streptomyces smyrnaeus TaxID=1387713 RepID=A0ABS3XZW3_9ACTN|nr:hypothetical protein [Streptomyces smyrnaeus]MBO8200929.1 hypothetical protein [Streptomyces smyrnaeus]
MAAPTAAATTGTGMANALERVDEISAFRLERVRVEKVPPNRLAAVEEHGADLGVAALWRALEEEVGREPGREPSRSPPGPLERTGAEAGRSPFLSR